MRILLASLLALLTILATLPTAEAADPSAAEPCHSGLGYDWCTVNAVVCQGEVRFYHGQPVTEAEADCPGVADCFVRLVSLRPSVVLCTFPTAAAAADPVECWDGINGDGWCGVHLLGCTVGRGYTSTPKFSEWIDAECNGVFDCRVDYTGLDLEHVECGFPTSTDGPTSFCDTTPHGYRCDVPAGPCRVYYNVESNGLAYTGFDCGVAECDFLVYNARLKSWDCS